MTENECKTLLERMSKAISKTCGLDLEFKYIASRYSAHHIFIVNKSTKEMFQLYWYTWYTNDLQSDYRFLSYKDVFKRIKQGAFICYGPTESRKKLKFNDMFGSTADEMKITLDLLES